MEYLDKTGLSYLWSKLKEKFSTMMAEPYKSGVNCVAGKYYTFNNKLYLCTKNTDGTIPVTNTTYFTNTTVGNELSSMKSTLVTIKPPKGVLVASKDTVWLTTGIVAPQQSGVPMPNYLITFSGDVSFDDPKATGEGESLIFTISSQDMTDLDLGAHWTLKDTNYGHFNFFHLTNTASMNYAIKVWNNTLEDVFIDNMRFNIICI